MTSLSLYLLPAILLAALHYAAPAEEGAVLSAPLNAIRMLLRKRSLEAALRAPPALYAEMAETPVKRDSDYWIWMPAHGYMPVPKDEISEEPQREKPTGTLLRYG